MSNPPPTTPTEDESDSDNQEAAFARWEQARPEQYPDGTTDFALTEEELLLDHEVAQSPEALLATAVRQSRFRLILTVVLFLTLALSTWLNLDDLTYLLSSDPVVNLGDVQKRWKDGERPKDGFSDRTHNVQARIDKALVTEERISASDVTYFFDPILRMIASTPRALPEKMTSQPAIHAAFMDLHGERWILPSDMTISFSGEGRLLRADRAPRRYRAIVKIYREELLLDSRLADETLWLFIDGETPDNLRAYGVVFGLALAVVILSIIFWIRSRQRVRILAEALATSQILKSP
ncbi:MAG: hypothetical protein VX223_07645 [Myxococcota bacterium]|nr:hypothetical protein [Myxococcota bacterium]